MKIAIIGYGKMGHAVEQEARARGHEIVAIIDKENAAEMTGPAVAGADVAIEFSTPDSAWDNIRALWSVGVPVVSGTTGWRNVLLEPEINAAVAKGATLLSSPNFSIGVNVTNAANRLIARMLQPYPEYTATVHEVHHIHKKDHPSGTAIMLADAIVVENDRFDAWMEPTSVSTTHNSVPVTHERTGEVPGIHTVTWDSPVDTITLTHSAKNRRGFALGALAAAEWIACAPKGHIYTMQDMFSNILNND